MALNASCVGWKSQPKTFRYDWKTLVLYALGIGAQASELDYLYEQRGPKVFPTFAVVPAIGHVFSCLEPAGIDLATVVHGAQTVRALGRLPPDGTLVTHAEITGLYDLIRFAQLMIRATSVLEDGTPMFETDWAIIVRGAGGFGGARPPKPESPAMPDGKPAEWRMEQATTAEQALLYRLSGDVNPLHADPEVARAAGFARGPILQGLATFGFAARAVVHHACGGDATRLTQIHGQFRKPVWPGETLVTEGWRVDGRVALQVSVKERGEAVLSGAWATVASCHG